MLAQAHAEAVFNQVLGTIDALTVFVNSLAGIPGRKTLLYISDGIPLVAGGEALRYAIELCDGTGYQEQIQGATDITSSAALRYTRFDPLRAKQDMDKYDTTSRWQALAAHANFQRVSFYPLQAEGLGTLRGSSVDAARTTAATETFGRRNKQDPLVLMAGETGGKALLGTNEFRPALEKMVSDSRHHYVLAYPPPRPGDGRRHRIRVEVGRPELSVRHRKSYRSKTSDEQISDGVLSTLFHGREENPLGVGLEVSGIGQVDELTSIVKVRVKIPFRSLTLLPQGGARHGLFTVFLAARDEAGGTTPVRSKSIPVRLPAGAGQEAVGSHYTYEVEMHLRRREHRLAVAVRDDLGGTTAYLQQVVPPPAP